MTANVQTAVPTRRVLAATTVGNLVEWYDYLLYAYLAPVIATLFFPQGNRTAALLGTFAVYGVSYLVRPAASPVLGALGDRIGRRTVLSMVILLMGAATFAIGLLPTFAQVGVLAPALLVLCRVVQGFAATGEWVGSLSFLAENTPTHRRGMLLAVNGAATIIPATFVSLLLLVFQAVMSNDAYMSWGWRLPFFLGGVLALVGFYIRNRTEESPAFREVQARGEVDPKPVRSALSRYPREMLAVFALTALMAMSTYTILTYLPTHLTEVVKLGETATLVASAVATLVFTLLIPLFGRLGDRFGRKPLLLSSAAALLVLGIPGWLLVNSGGMVGVYVGQLLIVLGAAGMMGGGAAVIVEIFPTRVRFTGGAVSQTFGYTLFGGTAAFVNQALVSGLHQTIAPAFYTMALAAVVLVVTALVLPETSRLPLLRDDDTGAVSR